MSYRLSVIIGAGLTAALAACGAKPDAKASAPAPDSTAVAEIKTDSSAGAIAADDDPTRRAAVPAGKDSAIRITMVAGRKKMDSTSFFSAIRAGMRAVPNWPKAPSLLPGSVLPAKRIVAFYGNPLSKRMGVLGEYPVEEMLSRLDAEVDRWRKADPSTPVQPALHLVAVTAQGAPGKDGMYRLRMDTALIEKVYGWAQRKNGLLFLDIQVGKSTVQAELPRLMPFLARPNVHLALDPEFSMHYDKEGLPPGKKIGTMMAQDVNWAQAQLSQLVAEKKLPPKILIVHRFTSRMVPNAEQIKLDPKVQIVMDMDGWGPPWLKFDSYRDYVVAHPVEFTGFKIFYHNDVKKGDLLLTAAEVLHLLPKPLYIQYQ